MKSRSALNWYMAKLACAVTLFLTVSFVVNAQNQDKIGSEAANLLSQSKQNSFVIFDFVGANRTMNPLGKQLADDFDAAILKAGGKFQLIDRSQVKDILEREKLEPQNILDPGIAAWLAQKLKARGMILGKFAVDITGVISLSFACYRSDNGKAIGGDTLAIPLTPEMRQLIPANLRDEVQACSSHDPVPCAGKFGYTSPKCKVCPQPAYSEEALEQKTQGTVLLAATIDANGKATDIRTVRALPYGLTLKAIEAVDHWTFVPATGPDGKPASVRQSIEVGFHLY